MANVEDRTSELRQEEDHSKSLFPDSECEMDDMSTLHDLTEKVKKCVTLAGMTQDMWQKHHCQMIGKFFLDPDIRILAVYIDKVNGLTVDVFLPNQENANEIAYFVCKKKVTIITADNFHEVIQWGTVRAEYLDGLLRIMNAIYAPMFFQNKAWPDSIKNDFSSQLHRFLASLTDIKHKTQGKTVLYIPNEGLVQDPEISAKDKEFVQRLESNNKLKYIQEFVEIQADVSRSVRVYLNWLCSF